MIRIMAFLNPYRLLFNALLLAVSALFTGQVWAVTITNFSFESPNAPVNPNFGCPPGWTCSPSGPPGPALQGGVYTPTSTQYAPGADGLPGSQIVPNGQQAAFFSISQPVQSLTQNTAATFVTGVNYTLSAWVGWRNDNTGTWSPDAKIEFLSAGTVVKTSLVIPSPGQGQWHRVVLNYLATAADSGKQIGVGLLGSTGNVQINWDNVTLVPEPTTLLLLGLGFALLAFSTRRTKI